MVHVVVDASVIASWFLPDEENDKYEDLLNSIDKIKIHVPPIFEPEFMNILLNAEKKKRVDNTTAVEILEIISRYPIVMESSTGVFTENINIYRTAKTYDLTAYDAAYLELAVRLNIPLITYDKPLLESAKKVKLKTVL